MSTTRVHLAVLYSALDSAATVMTMSSQDWSATADTAWLYQILVGWTADRDGITLAEMAERHHWDPSDVTLLNGMRDAVEKFDINMVAELSDLPALFELQWDRMTEATARWRAEDPAARDLVQPDLGDLLRWLMNDADQARAASTVTDEQIGAFWDRTLGGAAAQIHDRGALDQLRARYISAVRASPAALRQIADDATQHPENRPT